MTTITIENSAQAGSVRCETDMEAVEQLLEGMGYTLLCPIEDAETRARVLQHQQQNRHRSKDSYDRMETLINSFILVLRFFVIGRIL